MLTYFFYYNTMAHAGGRPGRYKTAKQLKYWVDLFFSNCKKENKRPKLTAMNVFLGVYPGYFNDKGDEFVKIIKDATAKVSEFYEDAIDNKQTSPALGIFMLKNCGYSDRIEVNANITQETSISELADEVKKRRAKQAK